MRPVILSCVFLLLACGGDEDGTNSTSSSSGSSSSSGVGAASSASSTGSGVGGGGGDAGAGGGEPVATVPFVYVGASDGTIAQFLLDRATGALTPQGSVPAGSNPSF